MSFISFLKKTGQVLTNIGLIEAGLAPAFKQIVPSAAPALDKFEMAFNNVKAVEGMFEAAYPGQQTGPQKLLAASSLIAPVLASLDAIAGTHTVDSAAKQAAILKITGGIADYMNALQGGNSTQQAALALPAPGQSLAQVITVFPTPPAATPAT